MVIGLHTQQISDSATGSRQSSHVGCSPETAPGLWVCVESIFDSIEACGRVVLDEAIGVPSTLCPEIGSEVVLDNEFEAGRTAATGVARPIFEAEIGGVRPIGLSGGTIAGFKAVPGGGVDGGGDAIKLALATAC